MNLLARTGRLFIQCGVAVFYLILMASSAHAADFPTRAITIVVPAPAGGPTDTLARMLADDMRKAWGQAVVIDNRPGASGMIATRYVASAPADGYTLLMTLTNHLTNPVLNPNAGYDPIKEFTPISLLVNAGAVLAFNPALPIKDWNDFVRYARARPGGVNLGNVGVGSSTHFYTAMIADGTKLKINSIPYKGEAQMVPDLLAGTLDFGLISIGPFLGMAKAGKLRGVAVTLPQRSAAVPELPTFIELGVPGPGSVRGWFGMLAPAGVPTEIANKLSQQIQRFLQQPEVRARLISDWAFNPVGSKSEEFAAILKDEYVEWAKAAKTFGIKLE